MEKQKSIELFHLALRAALRAGHEIMDVYRGPFDVTQKEDASPLTEADLRAHRVITEVLRGACPDIPILSEEAAALSYNDRKHWKQCWLVDPLDGTKEFVKRNGEFTVNIAWVNEQGRSCVGVVYAPALDRAYLGAQGFGAFRLDAASTVGEEAVLERATALPLTAQNRPHTVVASRSHMSDETAAFVEERRKTKPDLALLSAGSALKLCLVAEGSADCYPRFGPTMEWDTAAGEAICTAAGARITAYFSGAPMRYNKENLLNPWFLIER